MTTGKTTDPQSRAGSLPARVALGTMHGKERALAPAFDRLSVRLIVPDGLNTDSFGTFSAETPRAGSMEDAARAKIAAALAVTGLPVGLASEGAYGPHPAVPFMAAGIEILMWRDADQGHEIIERLGDDRPAYDRAEVADMDQAAPLLTRMGFPETALIVSPAGDARGPVAKGLTGLSELAAAIVAACKASPVGKAVLQTDMRAHMNPRRMSMIARLGLRLANRLACRCDGCGAPGWGRLGTVPGLPCSWCGGPSLLIAHEVHGCTACGTTRPMPRPDGKTMADPGECPACNP